MAYGRIVFGGGGIFCSATTNCLSSGRKKEKFTADYSGGFFGFSFGSPIGITDFELNFEDKYGSEGSLDKLNGFLSITQASYAIGDGISYGEVMMGEYSSGFSFSGQIGLDLSISELIGYGHIFNKKSECCN